MILNAKTHFNNLATVLTYCFVLVILMFMFSEEKCNMKVVLISHIISLAPTYTWSKLSRAAIIIITVF